VRNLSVVLVEPEDIVLVDSIVAATNHLHVMGVCQHTLRDEYEIPYGIVLMHESDMGETEDTIAICELAGLMAKYMIEPDMLDEHEHEKLSKHIASWNDGIFQYGSQCYKVTDFTKNKGGS